MPFLEKHMGNMLDDRLEVLIRASQQREELQREMVGYNWKSDKYPEFQTFPLYVRSLVGQMYFQTTTILLLEYH